MYAPDQSMCCIHMINLSHGPLTLLGFNALVVSVHRLSQIQVMRKSLLDRYIALVLPLHPSPMYVKEQIHCMPSIDHAWNTYRMCASGTNHLSISWFYIYPYTWNIKGLYDTLSVVCVPIFNHCHVIQMMWHEQVNTKTVNVLFSLRLGLSPSVMSFSIIRWKFTKTYKKVQLAPCILSYKW